MLARPREPSEPSNIKDLHWGTRSSSPLNALKVFRDWRTFSADATTGSFIHCADGERGIRCFLVLLVFLAKELRLSSAVLIKSA
jgi:hypothetical protein